MIREEARVHSDITALTWAPGFDMASIPEDVFKSELGRRNARKRQSYTGGKFWAKHNPSTPRCRCEQCMNRRALVKKLRAE